MTIDYCEDFSYFTLFNYHEKTYEVIVMSIRK